MDNRTKKTNNKRFVRYPEGAEMYSMSVSKFMQMAKDAKACYKVNQLVLVNLDIIDEYLETWTTTYDKVTTFYDSNEKKLFKFGMAYENVQKLEKTVANNRKSIKNMKK